MDMTTRTSAAPAPGNGAADITINKAAASLHGVVNKAAGAVSDAIHIANPVIDRVAQNAHDVVARVADAAGPASAWMREQGKSLLAAQRQARGDTERAISAHPWKTLAAALAAGFLISRFVR